MDSITVETPPPSKLEIVRAATNDPALATRKVTLGDREFPILDLGYDAYVLFMAQLQPLLEGLLGNIPGLKDIGLSDALTPGAVLTYCGKSLPEMARIVLAQSDPTITVADVKRLGKTPFALASVVLSQMEQNKIITDIQTFFTQVAPLLTAGMKKR